MPQLNSATFLSQMFWLIISFSLMWLMVGVFVVPKISDIVRRRQRKIDDYITAADEFQRTAQELVNRYNSALKQAEDEAKQYRENTEKQLEEQKQKMLTQATEEIRQSVSDNEAELRKIRDSISIQTDELATELAKKVLGKFGIGSLANKHIASTANKGEKNG